jgi:hypothetical protein
MIEMRRQYILKACVLGQKSDMNGVQLAKKQREFIVVNASTNDWSVSIESLGRGRLSDRLETRMELQEVRRDRRLGVQKT